MKHGTPHPLDMLGLEESVEAHEELFIRIDYLPAWVYLVRWTLPIMLVVMFLYWIGTFLFWMMLFAAPVALIWTAVYLVLWRRPDNA